MPHTVDMIIVQLGCSLEQVATVSGLSLERIQAIFDGRWTPSPEERGKIAAALQVSVEEVSWGHTMSPRNVRYHQFGLPDSDWKQA